MNKKYTCPCGKLLTHAESRKHWAEECPENKRKIKVK